MKKLLGLIATLVLLVMPMAFAATPSGATVSELGDASNQLVGTCTVNTNACAVATLTDPSVTPDKLELYVEVSVTAGAAVGQATTITVTDGTNTGTASFTTSNVVGDKVKVVMTTGDYFVGANFGGGSVSTAAGTDVDEFKVYTVKADQSAAVASAGTATATGGEISSLDLSTTSQTGNWQGFYGQVTGTIQLADALGNVMTSWTGISGVGNVYATLLTTAPAWANLQATTDALSVTDSAIFTAVPTSDSIEDTFTDNSNTAGTFAGQSIAGTDTPSVTLGNFEELILSVNAGGTTASQDDVVFAQVLGSASGFDGNDHDFELVLPTDAGGETYYFYVELQ